MIGLIGLLLVLIGVFLLYSRLSKEKNLLNDMSRASWFVNFTTDIKLWGLIFGFILGGITMIVSYFK